MGMPAGCRPTTRNLPSGNVLASLGAFLVGVSIIPFILNMVSSWVRGPKAPPQSLAGHRPGVAAALAAAGRQLR
jgi:heme/copper-type cytochrome/quinol oxidase subunit 1